MRRIFLLPFLFVLAACVGNVAGDRPIDRLLAGRTVIFGAAGATRDTAFWQSWGEDGTTRTGGPGLFAAKSGHWKVENGTYCEIFGLSTEWACWRITLSDQGRHVRFWQIPGDAGDLLIFHQDMEGFFAE